LYGRCLHPARSVELSADSASWLVLTVNATYGEYFEVHEDAEGFAAAVDDLCQMSGVPTPDVAALSAVGTVIWAGPAPVRPREPIAGGALRRHLPSLGVHMPLMTRSPECRLRMRSSGGLAVAASRLRVLGLAVALGRPGRRGRSEHLPHGCRLTTLARFLLRTLRRFAATAAACAADVVDCLCEVTEVAVPGARCGHTQLGDDTLPP
jgi:hypothetical protein